MVTSDHILVVDDDPDILKLAERVLASAGHTVLTASDVLSALDLMNRLQFDMLISDANMPHYNGFDLVTTIRKNSAYKNMSVAMLTGLRERKHVERAVRDAFADCRDDARCLAASGATHGRRSR